VARPEGEDEHGGDPSGARSAEAPEPSQARPVPLVVDLDGTLTPGDTLARMALRLALRRPWALPGMLASLRQGRDALKLYLWERAPIDAARLPLSPTLAAWLRAEAETGRPVLVASGSPQPLVDALVLAHPFLSEGLGTRLGHNLTGARKALALVQRFGDGGFDYVGNSRADLPVWSQARRAILCNAPRRVAREARRRGNVAMELREPGGMLRRLLP
jgi:phosphoserine phosphatase